MFARIVTVVAVIAANPVFAEDGLGVLNPHELTWESVLDKAVRGETGMMVCAHGYLISKKGEHEAARRLFESCAADGYTGAMTWLSHLDNNGLGGDYNPDAAAEWDRRAAEQGDPVGQFNYGLDLLRGHGVKRDAGRGREYVDMAAAAGLKVAQRLKDAGYDPDEVTPDADEWKYAPMF